MPNSEAPAEGTPDLPGRSRASVWHPCTQMHDHEAWPLVAIAGATGVWLETAGGAHLLDAVASWWTCLYGHRHPPLMAALAAQAGRLDHVLFAGFTHAPGVELAEALLAIAPPGLCRGRVFYTDNGSAAVEAALKMAFHHFQNRGEPARKRFLALDNGYHGETLGALAVGGTGLYRETYRELLLDPVFAPCPAPAAGTGQTAEEAARQALDATARLFAAHGATLCAAIVEPLVQCAGGMAMYHPSFLTGLRALCDAHGVLLIADEIATGFGRTGLRFACLEAGISPDLMCLSKGLTGGTLPLAAVLATEAIHASFYAPHALGKAFLHSHSYTGNPLACAVALAAVRAWDDGDWAVRNARTTDLLAGHLATLAGLPGVANARQTGMIVAFDLMDPATRQPFPASQRRGRRVFQKALEADASGRGAVLRPLGDTLYWMPPYGITADELAFLGAHTADAVTRVVTLPS